MSKEKELDSEESTKQESPVVEVTNVISLF